MRFFVPAQILTRLIGLLAVAVMLAASLPFGAVTALAQDANRDPREIALTDDDAGKSTTIVPEEEGSDERSRWVTRRWERERDSEDVGVGPIVTHNTVWVARDVEAARAIFGDQEGKQFQFPESIDRHEGPFLWKTKVEGADQVSTLGACVRDACDSRGSIDLHQRVVLRKGNVVTVVYLFGRSRNTTEELTRYFATKNLERI